MPERHRFIKLGLMLTTASGCATQIATQSGPLSLAQRPLTTVVAAEEFDPRPFRDDLLLIKPVFAPPRVSADPARRDSAVSRRTTTSQPVEQSDLAATQATPGLAEELSELSSSVETPAPSPAYRVQVIALSDGEVARRVAGDIRQLLDVPATVERDRSLFLVRAGEEASAESATQLRDRIASLHTDYGQAYVITPPNPEPPDSDLLGESNPARDELEPEQLAVEPERVRRFGWRVLVDQFLSHREAEALRHSAVGLLGRNDIEIVFAPPYYKVELGNFRNEIDAQLLAEQIKRKGYESALKVRAKVFVSVDEGL